MSSLCVIDQPFWSHTLPEQKWPRTWMSKVQGERGPYSSLAISSKLNNYARSLFWYTRTAASSVYILFNAVQFQLLTIAPQTCYTELPVQNIVKACLRNFCGILRIMELFCCNYLKQPLVAHEMCVTCHAAEHSFIIISSRNLENIF